jgi:hypothetical protein
MLESHFLLTIYHNFKVFQSVLFALEELLNIIEVYIKHRWVIKYIEMCA